MNVFPLTHLSSRTAMLFLLCFTAVGAIPVHAVTLASYSFNSTEVLGPTSTNAGVTSTAFGGTGTSRSMNSYAFQYPQNGNAGYMEFTLAANPGTLLDLTSISFTFEFLQSAGTNNPVNASVNLVYSTDSFATSTSIATFNDVSAANTSGVGTPTSTGAISLASIPDVESLTFRFMLTNTGSLNTTNYRYGIDSVVVVGDLVAAPEPAMPALLMASLGCLIMIRRRRI